MDRGCHGVPCACARLRSGVSRKKAGSVPCSLSCGRSRRYFRTHVGQKLSAALGPQVVVVNRPGANGIIGTDRLPRRRQMATRY